MAMKFVDYCNRVNNIVEHLNFTYNHNLLNENGCKARLGYLHIEFTLNFCDSYEELKKEIGLEDFTRLYGDLDTFKPLLRYLNSLPDVKE